MDALQISRLEDRIKAIEGQNRRLRFAVLCGTVAFLSLVVLMQCSWSGSMGVTTERLVLTDIQDRARAILEIDNDEPILSFYDYRGGKRMELGLFGGGWPRVSLMRGGDSSKRLELYLGPNHTEVFVDNETAQGYLRMSPDGGMKVGFQRPDGSPVVVLGSEGEDAPTVRLYDDHGNQIFKAPGEPGSGRGGRR